MVLTLNTFPSVASAGFLGDIPPSELEEEVRERIMDMLLFRRHGAADPSVIVDSVLDLSDQHERAAWIALLEAQPVMPPMDDDES
jgi:hypothetical protein